MLVRVVQVVLLLILAGFGVSLVIALFRPETGVLEKVALVGLLAACLALGGATRSVAARWQSRVSQRAGT